VTLRANAHLAGIAYLVYIAAGLGGMSGVTGPGLRVTLWLVESFCALLLAVSLHALVRDVDADIAMLGLVCRVAEAILGVMFLSTVVALRTMPPVADSAAVDVFTAINRGARTQNVGVSGTFFAAGSLAFCWLLLRGRLFPSALAWIGVLASAELLVLLPVQLAGRLPASLGFAIWLPMLAFEVPVAIWFIARGLRAPARGDLR
jgi:hypothetical protein